jgi:hypothetical protein
LESEDE